MRKIDKLIIHHSATQHMSLDAAHAEFRRLHMAKGWGDIGYHFLVDKDGNMLKTHRPIERSGAHTIGQNANSIGLCCIGNYHSVKSEGGMNHIPSDEMICRLSMHAAQICFDYKIDTSQIKGHGDYWATACPGDNLHKLLPGVRTMAHYWKKRKMEKGNG